MIKLLVAGDYCDNHRVSHLINKENYDDLFGNVKDYIAEHDIKVVNFEFPIASANAVPIMKDGPVLSGQDKSVTAIAYAGFNVCTLANNHIKDQGHKDCLYTRDKIRENGIQTVGVGENLDEANSVLYIKHGEETVAIINCCENEFSIAKENEAGACPVDPISQYSQITEARAKANYVVVISHGGHEFFQLPPKSMKKRFHYYVDLGADLVINHHQHCYSGYEEYKRRYIFYGLGNFLFDWNGKREKTWYEGFLLSIKLDHKITFELQPYTQCVEEPTIALMEVNEKKNFQNKILELNRIISDDSVLEYKLSQYYKSCNRDILLKFEPYNGKVLNKIYYMGLTPSLLNHRKLLAILNYIQCESHREKILTILKERLQ